MSAGVIGFLIGSTVGCWFGALIIALLVAGRIEDDSQR